MAHVLNFLAGALLCNCIPHLCAGLQGAPFPTPFAKPRGIGNSPPLVNFLWGAFNALAGLALRARFPVSVGFDSGFVALIAGGLAIGTYLSIHFGKVRSGALDR